MNIENLNPQNPQNNGNNNSESLNTVPNMEGSSLVMPPINDNTVNNINPSVNNNPEVTSVSGEAPKEVMSTTQAVNEVRESTSSNGTNINLQPEGMVADVPVNNTPEPLMGTTLTASSNLINNPQAEANTTSEMNNQNPQNVINPLNGEANNPFNNNMNNINGMNNMNYNLGPTPPNMNGDGLNSPKKKKKSKAPLIIILIFVLVCGVGFGVYYFLNTAKNVPSKPVVTPKLTSWELGDELPSDVSEYANISGIDASSCTVDKSAIDVDKVSKQTYSISCPGLSTPVTATLEIKDTMGPDITTKELTVVPNSEISIDDFIVSCDDASLNGNKCDIKLKDDSVDLAQLVKNAGNYDIELIASDMYENESEVIVNLIVDPNAPSKILSCVGVSSKDQASKATVSTSYEYGITSENTLYNAKKITSFKYDNEDDYKDNVNTFNTSKALNGISGTGKFDAKKYTITITSEIPIENLEEEFEGDELTQTLDGMIVYHENTRNESCSLS